MTSPSGATTWHVSDELLEAYAAGGLDAVLGASIERHVDRCPQCRTAVRPFADPRLLDQAWDLVRERRETPPLPGPLRLARRLGLQDSTGILLSAAASLRVAWFSGSVAALGFAALATLLGEGRLWPFLLVAPLIPVLGVAVAYGDGDDPFEVLAVTAPYGRPRLVLLRALGVLVSTLPLAVLMGLALPGPVWVAAAWLGPALALVPVLLALASFIGPRLAGSLVTMVWCGVVIGSLRSLPPTWPVEASQQVAYLGLALTSIGVLLVRSHRSRRMGVAL